MGKTISHYYSVKLDYETGTVNPSHLFSSMSKAIDAFKTLDIMMVRTINHHVKTVQTLEGLELGSIFTKIKQAIEYDDDEDLEAVDAAEQSITEYISRGKANIIRAVNENDKIDDVAQIEEIIDGLNEIAEESSISSQFNYQPPQANEVIETVSNLTGVTKELGQNENIKYSDDIETEGVVISKTSEIDIAKVEESTIARKLENEREMILKVKKPDFLGSSKWEFKSGKSTIHAKISDETWIGKFHSKAANVSPGDSLLAWTKVVEQYDRFGNLVHDEYTIIEVRDIIAGELIEDE